MSLTSDWLGARLCGGRGCWLAGKKQLCLLLVSDQSAVWIWQIITQKANRCAAAKDSNTSTPTWPRPGTNPHWQAGRQFNASDTLRWGQLMDWLGCASCCVCGATNRIIDPNIRASTAQAPTDKGVCMRVSVADSSHLQHSHTHLHSNCSWHHFLFQIFSSFN